MSTRHRVLAVVLAAGEGRRMHSALPKVLHPLCGKPMLHYILDSAAGISEKIIVVVGHGASKVKAALSEGHEWVTQKEQLGTGHAVLQTLEHLPDEGTLLVLCGDTPLIDAPFLKKLLQQHGQSAATVAAAYLPDPTGYGRVIRDDAGCLARVVEERDALDAEKAIKEINTGTYCFDLALLKKYLPLLTSENAQGEYYLPDVLQMFIEKGYPATVFQVDDPLVGLGINNRAQLAEAAVLISFGINQRHMLAGVTLVDPRTVLIDYGVKIGQDTIIMPGTVIEGATEIGTGCMIGPFSHLRNASIGDGAKVFSSTVFNARLSAGASLGPHDHLTGV